MLEGVYDGITRVLERRGWSLLIIAVVIGIVLLVSPWRECRSEFPHTTPRRAITEHGVYYQTRSSITSEQITTWVWTGAKQAKDDIVLMARCRGGEYDVAVSPLPRSIVAPTPSVEWLIDDQSKLANPPQWRVQSVGTYHEASLRNPERLRALISDANWLTLRIEDELEDWLELRFSVIGLFDTHIQPNLDHCGEY